MTRAAPATSRRPPSDRACDAIVGLLAVWTLGCHGAVALGGSLVHVVLLSAAFLAIVFATMAWRSQRLTSLADFDRPLPKAFEEPPEQRRLAAAVTLIGGLTAATLWLVARAMTPAWLAAAAGLAGALLIVWRRLDDTARRATMTTPATAAAEPLVWLLTAGCALFALVVHRPNIDDAFYVAMANLTYAEPDAPLHSLNQFGIPNAPLRPAYYRVLSIEPLAAALARLTGLWPITVLHLPLAAVTAALVVLAHARLLRLLAPQHWPVVLLLAVLFLMADGGAPVSFGNVTFVRAFQSKALLIGVALPLAIGYAIEYAQASSPATWCRLAAVVILAIGASPTGLVLAPAVAGLTLLAAWPSALAATWRAALAAAAIALYPAILALGLAQATPPPPASSALAPRDQFLTSAPALLDYSLAMIVGRGVLAGLALVVLVAGWSFAPTAMARRVLLALSVGCVLVFNPWVASLAAGYTSSLFTYWRVLWIVPLPTILALVIAAPLWLLPPGWDRTARFGAVLCLVALVALAVPRTTFSANNEAFVAWPGLKTDARWSIAEQLVRHARPANRVAAPEEVCAWITCFPGGPRPLTSRWRYLLAYRGELTDAEINDRIAWQAYLAGKGPHPAGEGGLAAALARYELDAVCLNLAMPDLPAAEAKLTRSGYRPIETPAPYRIWTRLPATHAP